MVVDIRLMTINDVKAVVQVHLASFSGFFLTFLGRQFLSELYAGMIADTSGIALVYCKDEYILGFVAGTSQPAGFYRRLLRRSWWRFGLASLGPVLRDPRIVPRLLRAFRKPQEVSGQSGAGTLMSLAVAPEMQGGGIGQFLVKAFMDESIRRGLKRIDLTTDRNNNNSVNKFYRRMGFQLSRNFVTAEGREMNEYIMDL